MLATHYDLADFYFDEALSPEAIAAARAGKTFAEVRSALSEDEFVNRGAMGHTGNPLETEFVAAMPLGTGEGPVLPLEIRSSEYSSLQGVDVVNRHGIRLLTLIIMAGALPLVACGEPTTLVDVEPYAPGIRPVLPPGEHWVDFVTSGSTLLGWETSRDLACIACAGDPAVAGFRMQLFRMDAGGPQLVAHTIEIPATGPVMFEHDIQEDPIGTEFLLRVTFRRSDGTTETCEERTRNAPPGIR